VPKQRRRHDHARVVSTLEDLQVSAVCQRNLNFDQHFARLQAGIGTFSILMSSLP